MTARDLEFSSGHGPSPSGRGRREAAGEGDNSPPKELMRWAREQVGSRSPLPAAQCS